MYLIFTPTHPHTHTCPPYVPEKPTHPCSKTTHHTITPSLPLCIPSSGAFFSATGQCLNCARYSETNCLLWWWCTFLERWWLPLFVFLPLGDFETDIVLGGSRFDFEVSFLPWPKLPPPSFIDLPLPPSISSPIGSASWPIPCDDGSLPDSWW